MQRRKIHLFMLAAGLLLQSSCVTKHQKLPSGYHVFFDEDSGSFFITNGADEIVIPPGPHPERSGLSVYRLASASGYLVGILETDTARSYFIFNMSTRALQMDLSEAEYIARWKNLGFPTTPSLQEP